MKTLSGVWTREIVDSRTSLIWCLQPLRDGLYDSVAPTNVCYYIFCFCGVVLCLCLVFLAPRGGWVSARQTSDIKTKTHHATLHISQSHTTRCWFTHPTLVSNNVFLSQKTILSHIITTIMIMQSQLLLLEMVLINLTFVKFAKDLPTQTQVYLQTQYNNSSKQCLGNVCYSPSLVPS